VEVPPGDTLEIRVLSMEPRLLRTNIAAWWGHLYDDFAKERITIYQIDAAAGLARAAFAFDSRPRHATSSPASSCRPTARRQAALATWCALRRTSGGCVARVRRELNSIPRRVRRQCGQLALRPGARCITGLPPGALCYLGIRTWRRRRGSPHRDRSLATRSCRSRFERTCLDEPDARDADHWIAHGFDEDLNRAMKAAARALLAFWWSSAG